MAGSDLYTDFEDSESNYEMRSVYYILQAKMTQRREWEYLVYWYQSDTTTEEFVKETQLLYGKSGDAHSSLLKRLWTHFGKTARSSSHPGTVLATTADWQKFAQDEFFKYRGVDIPVPRGVSAVLDLTEGYSESHDEAEESSGRPESPNPARLNVHIHAASSSRAPHRRVSPLPLLPPLGIIPSPISSPKEPHHPVSQDGVSITPFHSQPEPSRPTTPDLFSIDVSENVVENTLANLLADMSNADMVGCTTPDIMNHSENPVAGPSHLPASVPDMVYASDNLKARTLEGSPSPSGNGIISTNSSHLVESNKPILGPHFVPELVLDSMASIELGASSENVDLAPSSPRSEDSLFDEQVISTTAVQPIEPKPIPETDNVSFPVSISKHRDQKGLAKVRYLPDSQVLSETKGPVWNPARTVGSFITSAMQGTPPPLGLLSKSTPATREIGPPIKQPISSLPRIPKRKADEMKGTNSVPALAASLSVSNNATIDAVIQQSVLEPQENPQVPSLPSLTDGWGNSDDTNDWNTAPDLAPDMVDPPLPASPVRETPLHASAAQPATALPSSSSASVQPQASLTNFPTRDDDIWGDTDNWNASSSPARVASPPLTLSDLRMDHPSNDSEHLPNAIVDSNTQTDTSGAAPSARPLSDSKGTSSSLPIDPGLARVTRPSHDYDNHSPQFDHSRQRRESDSTRLNGVRKPRDRTPSPVHHSASRRRSDNFRHSEQSLPQSHRPSQNKSSRGGGSGERRWDDRPSVSGSNSHPLPSNRWNTHPRNDRPPSPDHRQAFIPETRRRNSQHSMQHSRPRSVSVTTSRGGPNAFDTSGSIAVSTTSQLASAGGWDMAVDEWGNSLDSIGWNTEGDVASVPPAAPVLAASTRSHDHQDVAVLSTSMERDTLEAGWETASPSAGERREQSFTSERTREQDDDPNAYSSNNWNESPDDSSSSRPEAWSSTADIASDSRVQSSPDAHRSGSNSILKAIRPVPIAPRGFHHVDETRVAPPIIKTNGQGISAAHPARQIARALSLPPILRDRISRNSSIKYYVHSDGDSDPDTRELLTLLGKVPGMSRRNPEDPQVTVVFVHNQEWTRLCKREDSDILTTRQSNRSSRRLEFYSYGPMAEIRWPSEIRPILPVVDGFIGGVATFTPGALLDASSMKLIENLAAHPHWIVYIIPEVVSILAPRANRPRPGIFQNPDRLFSLLKKYRIRQSKHRRLPAF